MINHPKDLNDIDRYLKQLKNAADKKLLQNTPQVSQVQLISDNKMPPGSFKRSKIQEFSYYAHPITIRAVKKGLFVAGDGFEDLEQLITCEACKKELDQQFWYFCPYCEQKF